jgi:hypothetical protein
MSSSGAPLSNNGFACSYVDHPLAIAVDQGSNVWVTNYAAYPILTAPANSVTELNSSGTPVSPFAGYTGGGLNAPNSIAIDAGGNAWITNAGSPSISELSNSGQAISPAAGFTGGGLSAPIAVAIDGAENVWVENYDTVISEFSNSGAAVSPSTGYKGPGLLEPGSIAIDASGNAWIPWNYGVLEFVGVATPVVTPLSVGVKNNTLGTRP